MCKNFAQKVEWVNRLEEVSTKSIHLKSFYTSFMGKMPFFLHVEVATWEIVTWEVAAWEKAFGKVHNIVAIS